MSPSSDPRHRLSCTVVVPVLDDGPALERCLTAIEGQLLPVDEVVVVDNGSADDSVRIAERHGARVLHESTPGIPAAAATGYDAVASDLILRLDADSVPPADWSRRIVDRFTADRGLDAMTGPGVFTAVPRPVREVLTGWYWWIYFRGLRSRVGAAPLFGSNLAMRTSAWRRVSRSVHREDSEVHDDLDLSIHLVDAGHRLALDRGLLVSVSARPLLHPVGMRHRARRARHTLDLHRAGRPTDVVAR